MKSFEGYEVKEYVVLESDNCQAKNGYQNETIKPIDKKEYEFADGIFRTKMKECSWNVIRFVKIK